VSSFLLMFADFLPVIMVHYRQGNGGISLRDYEIKYLKNKILSQIENQSDALSLHKELGYEDSVRENLGELSTYDNHPADLGSETFELSKQFALSRHLARQLDELNYALEKMKKGEYGICELCGREIGFERLDIIPEARLCIKCEKEKKVSIEDLEYDEPVEQALLEASYSRSFADETSNSYDGEDAWQEVQFYGSSSGPQDLSTNDTFDYDDTWYNKHEDISYVEDVEKISNEAYKQQLPDSHGDSYDGYITTDEAESDMIDYFGEDGEDDSFK